MRGYGGAFFKKPPVIIISFLLEQSLELVEQTAGAELCFDRLDDLVDQFLSRVVAHDALDHGDRVFLERLDLCLVARYRGDGCVMYDDFTC